MSTELLREAARLMRNNNASFEHKRTNDQATFLAVADLLDREAVTIERLHDTGPHGHDWQPQAELLAVARAYLGDES